MPGPARPDADPAPACTPHSGAQSVRAPTTRARIVHVSADLPDTVNPAKTRAIETLIGLAQSAFDQQVFSLNRANVGAAFWTSLAFHPSRPRLDVQTGPAGPATTPLVYRAPGKGIYHVSMLRQLGEWLAERLAGGERPALIVGHKLTFEGLAVAEAARLLDIPYALTIQGNSDLKVLDRRPDLRARIAACYHGAAVAVAFAPWAVARVTAHLGARQGPTMIIPCAVANDRCVPPRTDGDGLISAFHLFNYRLKNLGRMARAISRPGPVAAGARLGIIGTGTPAEIDAAQTLAMRHGHGAVVLEGALPLQAMPGRMNRATGYIMPSLRESFGLVFIEALMAGLPIAYPRGWAVDGYFTDLPFAIPVEARSIDSIADAMARLVRDEGQLKQALARWQETGGADRFRTDHIAARYIEALHLAVAGGRPDAA